MRRREWRCSGQYATYWAALSCLLILLTACGSHGNVTGGDFSLTVTPSTLSLVAGGSGVPVTVTAPATDGFSGTVTAALTGLPTGVSASSTSVSLAPGTTQTVTLTADSSAAVGTANVTVTGTSGALSQTATLALTVSAAAPTPDFTLAIAPSSLSVQAGGSAVSGTITVIATNGFNSPVSVALSGLPSEVTVSPSTLSVTPGTPQAVSFTASAGAAVGTATIIATGTSGSLSHTATASLAVTTAAPAADFALTISPASLSIQAGGSAVSETIAVTAANGFSSPVAVTFSGLPSGVTANPATLSVMPGTPQTVSFTASSAAAAGAATITATGTSGSLSHTATASLVVTAAADFTLSWSPATLSMQQGGLSGQSSLSATAANGFSGSISVSFATLPAGISVSPSTFTLSAGEPQTVTVTVANSAAAGNATVTATGTSGALSHTANLAVTVTAPPGVDVTTYHYNNFRSGVNATETSLTLSSVNSSGFGLLRMLSADGKVDGEPLVLSSLNINGVLHNVVYVVSEHDSVYAFDIDTGAQLWMTSVLGSGETTAAPPDSCGQVTPEIGITSTPVIDRTAGANGTIFVVAMSQDSTGAYHQRLHALDVTTGAELDGGPTEITATYPGTGDDSSNGQVNFDPSQYKERVGLLLLNQTLYLTFASHCDVRPYTGWVMAYSESTLKQTTVLNLTPNGHQGGIWMSGAGMAADSSGNIFLIEADGTLDTTFDANGFPSQSDYGNSVLRLSTANGGLAVADYWTPFDTAEESVTDIDLGSGAALPLPDQVDANGVTRHLVLAAGKPGNIFVVDRDNMGKFHAGDNSNVYQELSDALPGGSRSMPVYFNGTVYYGSVSGMLRAFPVTYAKLALSPSSTTSETFDYPGATPTVSANGTTNGIVWAVMSDATENAVLHAYDASDLATELYNSTQAANNRDGFGLGNKFITPMVANGKVFVGTTNGVAVFGLLN